MGRSQLFETVRRGGISLLASVVRPHWAVCAPISRSVDGIVGPQTITAAGAVQAGAAQARAALAQFGTGFAAARKSRFDCVLDGLNRLPRPLMVAATLALFGSAMVDPVWFGPQMQGLVEVPEPLWWRACGGGGWRSVSAAGSR